VHDAAPPVPAAGVHTHPGTAVHCCSLNALHVPSASPPQFACQKQPGVSVHDANAVSDPQASPVFVATPVQVPESWHPGTFAQSPPDRPGQAGGCPLQVPALAPAPELLLLLLLFGSMHETAAPRAASPAAASR